MKVLMAPHVSQFRKEESGIRRVVEAYFRYLPQCGIELVPLDSNSYDLKAVHAGTGTQCDVAHCHGLYWTADYPAESWEYSANKNVIETLRQAKEITVPSTWVAETLQRDMRVNPHVVGHGIDWQSWQHQEECDGYILWNKNRAADVCDPGPLGALARAFPKEHFVTTFPPIPAPGNIQVIKTIPHEQMKLLIQRAGVYLSTTKETFGIGTLEAMAAGIPILGFAHGGNLGLVQHGVNGYLAKPGNDQDLAAGLAYCLANREVLGANGRAIAKGFTWEKVAEQVAGIYRLALYTEEPTCAIVIPSYNYGSKVGRAIESAIQQTYNYLTDIVVVDDGSTDNTREVVTEWVQRDKRVKYLYQNNRGVAHARNAGIASVNTKYVCCLDADDAIAPLFVERCIEPLEKDRSLGLAYTSLYYIRPDGQEGISKWPGDYNYDLQLRRQNQVPTCCVMRREMWARLGGYHQRFAPEGAGSEDAEFFTRAGAYGWGAVKATEEPLFIYSWLSGRVSGNKDYQEVDWLTTWHPWAKDGQHPFASLATPVKMAHPVRQYDQPLVSVIIPVGPGHEEEIANALDSLEAQALRQWEAIIAWDSPNALPDWIAKAYPYMRVVKTDGAQGAGAARNLGRTIARGAFLLFLDADDWLYPDALSKMLQVWEETGEVIVYSDYVGKAIIDDVTALAPDLQKRILARNGKTHDTVIGYQATDYDCRRAQQQPEGDRPYLWCNITSLVPTAWHDEIGGFDETMPSWEDIDYWYRMARAGKCFVRIPEPLLVYRFYSGGRRDAGVELHQDLIGYMKKKYEEIPVMGCSACGKKNNAPSPKAPAYPEQMIDRAAGAKRQEGVAAMSDSDFVMCRYKHPNLGDHRVFGAATFAAPIGVQMIRNKGVWRIDYGYRGGGGKEVFLVHRLDVKAAPHLFEPVEEKPRVVPVPAPAPVAPVPVAPTPPPSTIAPVTPVVEKKLTDPFDMQTVVGITAEIAEQLTTADIATLADLLQENEETLLRFKGVGKKRAELIMRSARDKAAQLPSGR